MYFGAHISIFSNQGVQSSFEEQNLLVYTFLFPYGLGYFRTSLPGNAIE